MQLHSVAVRAHIPKRRQQCFEAVKPEVQISACNTSLSSKPQRVCQARQTTQTRATLNVTSQETSLSFCEICGDGSGIVPCPECRGVGQVSTKPGGAGRPFYVGMARCKQCSGLGEVACAMCAGYEKPLSPLLLEQDPNPHPDKAEDDLSWLDEL